MESVTVIGDWVGEGLGTIAIGLLGLIVRRIFAVTNVVLEFIKSNSRIEAQLTACFELLLIMVNELEGTDIADKVQGVERRLREALARG